MAISKSLRNKFPVLGNNIYMNTATLGPLSEDLLEWRQEHDLDFLVGGSEAKTETHLLINGTRETVARFFNAIPDNVALTPSFSQGLNLLLEGLNPLEKVLLVEGDYPSLNWPFKSRGFPIEYVAIGEGFEERVIGEIQRKDISVFACSAVQWLNGYKIDFDFLKRLKSDFPELLILVDGTQYCGTEYFDFTASGVDIMGASGYKWLLSGYGNGFLMVRPEIQNRFDLKSMGYGSGRNAAHQRDGGTFCEHLEPGHLDPLSFGSLQFSMQLLMDIGLENIGEHNQGLAKYVKEQLVSLELLDDFMIDGIPESTIFNIKGKDKYNDLVSNNVICAKRGDGIRLSFHFYNTLKELESIIEILKN